MINAKQTSLRTRRHDYYIGSILKYICLWWFIAFYISSVYLSTRGIRRYQLIFAKQNCFCHEIEICAVFEKIQIKKNEKIL